MCVNPFLNERPRTGQAKPKICRQERKKTGRAYDALLCPPPSVLLERNDKKQLTDWTVALPEWKLSAPMCHTTSSREGAAETM